MSEHPTDAHFLFTFVFKQALKLFLTADSISEIWQVKDPAKFLC